MNDYQQVRLEITPCSEDATDLMAGMLADVGFESFVPDENGLTAYVRAEDYDAHTIATVINDFPFDAMVVVTNELVEGRDWNSEWEKNYFKPIVVGDRCVIHSTFHTDVPKAEYDIVIDPKMAFGTGHHATTAQVIEALLETPLDGASVIDMGTGTAILAILASMCGAQTVTGIEIDGFAYNNAVENVSLNSRDNITLINGDATALVSVKPADVFVANINRNVITGDFSKYAKAVKPQGVMILSGFYTEDIPVVAEVARRHGFVEYKHTELNRWTCLRLKRG